MVGRLKGEKDSGSDAGKYMGLLVDDSGPFYLSKVWGFVT